MWPLSFNDCTFKFYDLQYSIGAPDFNFLNGGPVNFTGCLFTYNNNGYYRLSFANPGQLTFKNCMFDAVPMFAQSSRAFFDDCQMQQSAYSLKKHYFGSFNRSFLGATGSKIYGTPHCVIEEPATNSYIRWRDRNGWTYFNIHPSGAVSVPLTHQLDDNGKKTGRAYFTLPEGTAIQRLRVGDFITSSTGWYGKEMPAILLGGIRIGMVESITETPGSVDTISLVLVPLSVENGNYVFVISELPTIRRRTVGSIVNGSNVITNVNINHGWSVNDRISGANIPSGAYVTAVSGNEITISMNATASITTELYDAKLILEYAEISAAIGAPTGGAWVKGDYLKNSTGPSNDGNNMMLLGWICTASGAPGTWAPVYGLANSMQPDTGPLAISN
jgi:hypothetical protein